MRDKEFRAIYEPDKNTSTGYLMFVQKKVNSELLFVMENDNGYSYPFYIPFVDNDWIVMESLSVKDDFGNKIFEKDIIEVTEHDRVVKLIIVNDIRTFTREYDRYGHAAKFRVIGNIYLNNNLLKENE